AVSGAQRPLDDAGRNYPQFRRAAHTSRVVGSQRLGHLVRMEFGTDGVRHAAGLAADYRAADHQSFIGHPEPHRTATVRVRGGFSYKPDDWPGSAGSRTAAIGALP